MQTERRIPLGKTRQATTTCVVLGTGNIGTDLMAKLLRSPSLELTCMVGIDPDSQGLATARQRGVDTTSEGIDWILRHPDAARIVFDATSAAAHVVSSPKLRDIGSRVVDLTPSALGPGVVPAVNSRVPRDSLEVSLISCGGQATIPMVAAVSRVSQVPYAEIVATIASRSAGPGTRQNIDEFTRTTARGLIGVGGARTGKAIIILNPADPPILMRNTVYCELPPDADRQRIVGSIREMAAEVSEYVPGYRLRGEPVFDADRVVIFLEIEGVGDFLPTYAGNLDIMTAAAVRVGEDVASVAQLGTMA